MDRWAWEQLDPWLRVRVSLPVGALLCVIDGPTQGRPWSPAAVRTTLRSLAVRAGVLRRFAPHQLRHAHAVEMAREGVSLNVIQRQLGHANLGITSVYLTRNRQQRDHRDGGGLSGADAASERWPALAVVAQSSSGLALGLHGLNGGRRTRISLSVTRCGRLTAKAMTSAMSLGGMAVSRSSLAAFLLS